MQSLNSLSKAYVHHEKEKKLLNSIGQELNQFWDEVGDTKKYVVLDEKQGEGEKVKAKEGEKQKEGEKAAATEESKPSQPADEAKVQLNASGPMDVNFLQTNEDTNEDHEEKEEHEEKNKEEDKNEENAQEKSESNE